MLNNASSRDAAYFESIYRGDPDPWRFATSAYERQKYAATLSALGGRRYRRALEIGCSIGVLTRQLAGQCDAVLGVDIAEAPLLQARARCEDLPTIAFRQLAVPGDWPEGQFDLILLSEVLYFLAPADITRLARRALGALEPDGRVLLVNWLGTADNPCGGDEAADIFIGACGNDVSMVMACREAGYRMDLLSQSPAANAVSE